MRDRVSRHKRVLSPLHPLLQVPEAILNSHSFIDVLSSDTFLATVIIVDFRLLQCAMPGVPPQVIQWVQRTYPQPRVDQVRTIY